MSDLPDELTELHSLFAAARVEAGRGPSVVPSVDGRVATALMQGRRSAPAVTIIGLVVALLIGAAAWQITTKLNSRVNVSPTAIVVRPETLSVSVNNVELVQRLASLIDGRAVVVVWSCRGDGFAPASPMPSSAKYRSRVLRQITGKDGATECCVLFLAGDGVRPVLEPPSLRATTLSGQVINFAISPQVSSRERLAAELQYCPIVASNVGDIIEEIERDLKR